MEDDTTLREICAAQRDRVVAATATPVAAPRASPYARIPLSGSLGSLRRLAPSSRGRDTLQRSASLRSDTDGPPVHKGAGAARGASGSVAREVPAGKPPGWASRLLCCGGHGVALRGQGFAAMHAHALQRAPWRRVPLLVVADVCCLLWLLWQPQAVLVPVDGLCNWWNYNPT